jgi:cell wall-associated NlpC family hydrolase
MAARAEEVRCGVEVAALRAAPRDDAEQVSQALRDERLRVEERRAGSARVRTEYGYVGWIGEAALEPGPGRPAAPWASEPLEAARTYRGAPYEWGGMTRAGIDCSGLVHMAFRAVGRVVPRDSWQQEEAGAPVLPGDERPGDVVVYGSGERADHVSLWCGGGNILHATARDGLGVIEKPEPKDLRARRRVIVRLG